MATDLCVNYTHIVEYILSGNILMVAAGLVVKALTVDQQIQESSLTCNRDLFLSWVNSALPQNLTRRFSFASFRADVNQSVPENPLKKLA